MYQCFSSSEGSGSSRLPSARDSIELNRIWCHKKSSRDLENLRSNAPSKSFLFPVDAKQGPSSNNKQAINTGPLECDSNTSTTSVQPNVTGNSNKLSCWSYLRFW